MILKPPLSFKDQVELLKQKELLVENDLVAIDYLSHNNYYHLNKYFHDYINSAGMFCTGTKFSTFIKINENDKFLRNILFRLIDPIEAKLKTVLSNYLGLKYGPKCFYDNSYSKDQKYWGSNFTQIMDGVFRDCTHPVVQWHIKNYESDFPIWVIMEFATFTAVSRYYSNLIDADRNMIGNLFYEGVPGKKLSSWFNSIGLIRNKCAHGGHLFREHLTSLPQLPNNYVVNSTSTYDLFLVFFVIKELSSKTDWDQIKSTLIQKELTDPFLADYGFPVNWNTLLF